MGGLGADRIHTQLNCEKSVQQLLLTCYAALKR